LKNALSYREPGTEPLDFQERLTETSHILSMLLCAAGVIYVHVGIRWVYRDSLRLGPQEIFNGRKSLGSGLQARPARYQPLGVWMFRVCEDVRHAAQLNNVSAASVFGIVVLPRSYAKMAKRLAGAHHCNLVGNLRDHGQVVGDEQICRVKRLSLFAFGW